MTEVMKGINVLFWAVVAAIGVTFGGSVYTAIQHKKETRVENPSEIVVPATLPEPGAPAQPGQPPVPASP
jgi:hypothetical protein